MKKILLLIISMFLIFSTAYSAQNCIAGDCINGAGVFKYKDGSKYTGKLKMEKDMEKEL